MSPVGYDILCFLLCMFLLYITVLLPVGVIKDDNGKPEDDDHHKSQRGSIVFLTLCVCLTILFVFVEVFSLFRDDIMQRFLNWGPRTKGGP